MLNAIAAPKTGTQSTLFNRQPITLYCFWGQPQNYVSPKFTYCQMRRVPMIAHVDTKSGGTYSATGTASSNIRYEANVMIYQPFTANYVYFEDFYRKSEVQLNENPGLWTANMGIPNQTIDTTYVVIGNSSYEFPIGTQDQVFGSNNSNFKALETECKNNGLRLYKVVLVDEKLVGSAFTQHIELLVGTVQYTRP